MPATNLAATTIPGQYSQTGTDISWVALDAVNGNSFTATENMLLLVWNSGGTGRNFQITSQPDPTYGREGDVNMTIPDGDIQLYNLTKNGWADANGKINISAAHADLKAILLKFA